MQNKKNQNWNRKVQSKKNQQQPVAPASINNKSIPLPLSQVGNQNKVNSNNWAKRNNNYKPNWNKNNKQIGQDNLVSPNQNQGKSVPWKKNGKQQAKNNNKFNKHKPYWNKNWNKNKKNINGNKKKIVVKEQPKYAGVFGAEKTSQIFSYEDQPVYQREHAKEVVNVKPQQQIKSKLFKNQLSMLSKRLKKQFNRKLSLKRSKISNVK
jgi:hypothetical protein